MYVVPSEGISHPARLCGCTIISSQRLGAGCETSEEDCYSLHATDTVYVAYLLQAPLLPFVGTSKSVKFRLKLSPLRTYMCREGGMCGDIG